MTQRSLEIEMYNGEVRSVAPRGTKPDRYIRTMRGADGEFYVVSKETGALILSEEQWAAIDAQKQLRTSRRNKIAGRFAAAVAALSFAGVMAVDSTYDHYTKQAMDMTANPDSDAIVVLTGAAGRIPTALQTCGPNQKMLISGTGLGVTLNALCGVNGLNPAELNLNPANVTVSSHAMTTEGNAEEIAVWLAQNQDIQSLTVITSEEHAARTLVELQRTLPDHIQLSFLTVGDGEIGFEPVEALQTTWRAIGLPTFGKTLRNEETLEADLSPP